MHMEQWKIYYIKGPEEMYFWNSKKCLAPPKKKGKNLETLPIVIVQKVLTPPFKRYLFND